jgi:tetratricopeptide (TPR) repeat protein
MRDIAKRAGRGNVSSSTVHNVFRGSRVPRWDFLETIITALGGAPRRDEFHALWDAAWLAQNDGSMPRNGRVGAMHAQSRQLERSARTARPTPVSRGTRGPGRPLQRIWSNEIPARNPNFSGRATELEALASNLDSSQSPHIQVISGMGGIGKTELATEYIHLNIDKYDIVWWIRAEHHDRVREALVSLARRLEPRLAGEDSSRDRVIAAVLEKLQSETGPSWLLVYDNVANPFDVERYVPASRLDGHIIVTLRQRNWPSSPQADLVEVSPFTQAEAISFLHHRVPGLAARDAQEPGEEEDVRGAGEAGRLAAELGYLPIAIDHAAAYLTETKRSVDEYLTRFKQNANDLLQEQHGDVDPHAHVSGTWALSNEVLTADARHLFNLCAFFSPEPIAAKLFLQDTTGIDSPPGLAEFLSSSSRFRAAETQLHRLSLAKVDAARDLIQMHRVVQAVTKGRLREDHIDQRDAYRAAVDSLLAKSNPGNPDQSRGDATYDLSLQHLESDHRFLFTANPALRDLIIDQVRRLHLRGAHVEAMQFGQEALEVWRERHGEYDLRALTMAVEVAVAMYRGGRVADAHELIRRIRPLLQLHSDEDGFKAFLLCESIYGGVLRARSQFHEALNRDLDILPKFESAFGVTNERTLNVRNNIAFDYRQLGLFREALDYDERTFEDRRTILGPSDPLTLHSHNAVARDWRGLGEYEMSLDIAREVWSEFEAARGRENAHWLRASEGFATALRKAGHHVAALQQREHVLQRCRDYLGDDHMFTLSAATNLINDRRAVKDFAGAEELAHETYGRCRESSPPDDLLLYAAQLNLASVLRAAGNAEDALWHDEQARNGLIRIYGELHPFTLAANINYASDLASCARLGEAIQLGHDTLVNCEQKLGGSHPDTLMAKANLAADEAAAGEAVNAEALLDDVLRRYAETLTLEHPEARAAAEGERLTAEIEPEV